MQTLGSCSLPNSWDIIFWRALRATNKLNFDFAMNKIKKIKPSVYEWLLKNDPHTWSCHLFNYFFKIDHVTNNMSESWNEFLNKHKRKPVIELLKFIRLKLMKKMIRRRETCLEWPTNLSPRVQRKINELSKVARKLLVIKSSKHQFEVVDFQFKDERHFVVDFSKLTCDCLGWQLSRLPCKHALAYIMHSNLNPANYIDKLMTKEVYLATYSSTINILPHKLMWPRTYLLDLKHPQIISKAGRPKYNQRKDPNEPLRERRRYPLTKVCKCFLFWYM